MLCLSVGDVIEDSHVKTKQRMLFVEVKVLSFTKGKKQSKKKEVNWRFELSLARIHMERIIGQLKQKCAILQGILSISFVSVTQACSHWLGWSVAPKYNLRASIFKISLGHTQIILTLACKVHMLYTTVTKIWDSL